MLPQRRACDANVAEPTAGHPACGVQQCAGPLQPPRGERTARGAAACSGDRRVRTSKPRYLRLRLTFRLSHWRHRRPRQLLLLAVARAQPAAGVEPLQPRHSTPGSAGGGGKATARHPAWRSRNGKGRRRCRRIWERVRSRGASVVRRRLLQLYGRCSGKPHHATSLHLFVSCLLPD